MYLHEDREQFADAVRKSVQHTNMSEMIIEKDYLVPRREKEVEICACRYCGRIRNEYI